MIPVVAAPAFEREGLGYRFNPTGVFAGLTLRATHIVREKQAVWVLLGVSADTAQGWPEMPGAPKRFNLFTSSSLASTARYFSDAAGKEIPGPADWQVMIDAFAEKIVTAEKQGTPFEWIDANDPDDPDPLDVVRGLVQADGINLLFGPQGAGKGWLSMALALCVQYDVPFLGRTVAQQEVLYLDREANRRTFKRRMQAVARGLGIPNPRLRWLQPPTELIECVDWLSRIVAEEHIGLYFVDSVGRLSTPVSEHVSWEATARELSRVQELLSPATAFLIDHVTGADYKGGKLAGKAGGAIRKMADARMSWEVQIDQEAGADYLHIALHHSKNNDVKKALPIGLRLDFESDDDGRANCVRFSYANVADSEGLSKALTYGQRALHALRGGRLNTNEIASELGVTREQAKSEMNALKRKGLVLALNPSSIGGRNNVQVWGLPAETVNGSPLRKSSYPTVSGAVPGPPENRSNGRRETVVTPVLPTVSENRGRVWWGDADDEGERF